MLSATLTICVLFASIPQTDVQAPPPQDATTRYSRLLLGKVVGFQTTTRERDGTLRIHFEYSDRGRGPKIDQTIALSPSGTPVSVESSGVDYFKAPVSESFRLQNGKATWKNRCESGERELRDDAFYTSVSGTPEESHLLVLALLRAPGNKLPLLPEGEVALAKKTELKVDVGGRSHDVTLYWVSGLGFNPEPTWIADGGERFATVTAWASQVPEGWESVAPTLLAAQDEAARKRGAELAKTLARKPARPLAFVHARLFDAEAARALPGQTVVVTGNRITAVGPDGSIAPPADAEIIDAAGRTLLPGLWDMHVHIGPGDGLLNVAAGVTTVRDLGNDVDMVTATRDRFDQGLEIGPRMILAGFIDGRGPYQGPTKVFADDEAEGTKAIERYAKLGYAQIKLYSSLKCELVAPLAKVAHAHGLRVSGHVPSGMRAEQFVRDGADEIQHMNFVFLNFLPKVTETRTPARFTEVAAHAREIDLASEPVAAFIRLLKERGTVVDPTLNIFENMFTDRPGKLTAGWASMMRRLPADVRRNALYGGLEVPDGMDEPYRESFRRLLEMARVLDAAGVPIVAGTDALAGFALHRELELYAEAGIPAPRVLQIATLGAARVMKRDAELGSITTGKLADLVLVDGDPTVRITDIERVQLVVKDGVVHDVAAIDRAIGVAPLPRQ